MLHRLNLTPLVPRPRHDKNDVKAMEEFKKAAPPFVQKVTQDIPDKMVRVFFMDEARFGQKGTLTRKQAEKGTRPVVTKQTRYESVSMYGAVEPAAGDNSAFLPRHVNTETMNELLNLLSTEVGAGDHIALIMDQAVRRQVANRTDSMLRRNRLHSV